MEAPKTLISSLWECPLRKNGCSNSLKKLSAIFVIPLMLLGAFLVPSFAHAGTGVVSVNGGTLVSAPNAATTVNVPIQISGSNALNGFDIQVVANPSILQASSVSLSGSVLSSGGIILECVNGVLVVGATCSSQDGPGVLHLAVVTLGSLTPNPTTGLLFTITYKIIGSTVGTPISFNTGCLNTSIPNGDCVTVSNGTLTPVPETDQGTTFANLIDFTVAPAFSRVSTPAGVSITDVINYASLGGFSDILVEKVTASAGLTATLTSGSVNLLSPATTGSDTLTLSAATGDYSATVSTCGSFYFPSTCHSATIPVHVAPAGISLTLSKSGVTIPRGNTDSSTTINLAGASGFNGLVTFTSSSVAGIAGTAPSATLTSDGSGYSSATSTLTIAVSSSVATGTYTLTVTGSSGASSSMASIAVTVPGQGFGMVAVPNSIGIVRGGSVAANLNIVSLGNFAATITFTTVITNQGTDSCCFTNNISPAYSPASLALSAGASATVAFFASTVGGSAPATSFTATGNYTAAITATAVSATSGTVVQTATITFNIQDFSVGPAFCNDVTFTNNIATTPNGLNYPVAVTTRCSSLSITDQPFIPDPDSLGPQTLWVQSNALGGLVTDGFNGTPAIAALNGELPDGRGGTRGIIIPQLAATLPPDIPNRMCVLPTFWANGTQIPYSYLATHGPLVTPGPGLYLLLSILTLTHPSIGIPPGFSNWGCRFDAGIFPNDHGIDEWNTYLMTHYNRKHTMTLCQRFGPDFFFPGDPGCPYPTFNNPDFWGVTAMSIVGTQAGAYTFKLCAQGGVLTHCQTYGLNVLASAIAHQLVVSKTISFSASGGSIPFKIGVTNPDVNTVYAQVTVTGLGSFGDTFTVTSPVFTIAPNANTNNILLTFAPLTKAMIGESFTFSFSIAESLDPNNLDGTSTVQSVQKTFTILA
jgi:hypothetical protein